MSEGGCGDGCDCQGRVPGLPARSGSVLVRVCKERSGLWAQEFCGDEWETRFRVCVKGKTTNVL